VHFDGFWQRVAVAELFRWTASRQLGPPFHGDYLWIDANGGFVYGVWTDNRMWSPVKIRVRLLRMVLMYSNAMSSLTALTDLIPAPTLVA
jgi:hypothetical protein